MPDFAETPDVQLIKISHNAFGKVNTGITWLFCPFMLLLFPLGLLSPQQCWSLNRLFVSFYLEKHGIEHRHHNQGQYRGEAQAEHDNDRHVEEEHVG